MAIAASLQSEVGRLLGRVSLKDQHALRALYDLIGGQLAAVALRIVRNGATADEVVQDVFVTIWNKAGDYSGVSGLPMTWLIGITRNRAIDLLRSTDDAVSLQDLLPPDEGGEASVWDPADDNARTPLQNMLAKLTGSQIETCMQGLEPSQRQCIALAFFHGLSHSELAEHIAQPLGTVKAWVRRGLERLGRCMQAADPAGGFA